MPSASVPTEHVLSKLSAIIAPDMPLPEAALAYAASGIAIFPCGEYKKPLVSGGFHKATTEASVIRTWWKRWPMASIGCPTGEALGAFVLDVDLPDGLVALETLAQRHGRLSVTLEQRTGSGGRHLFFRMPTSQDVRNSASKLGINLDMRGTGGYVILPPSRHPSGGRYTWHNSGMAVADSPAWLLRELLPQEKAASPNLPVPARVPVGTTPYGARALEEEASTMAGSLEGSRNATLNQSAFAIGQLVGGGEIDRLEAESALLAAAQQAGLPSSEAQKTLQSGLAAGERSPRQAPPQRSNEPRNVTEAAVPVAAVRNTPHFFSRLALEEFSAGALMAKPQSPLTWLLKDSLMSGTVGFVCGAPGVGKST